MLGSLNMSDGLLVVLVTALVNGLVTWGVIKTKLDFLTDGVREAKAAAAAAHERIDRWMNRP